MATISHKRAEPQSLADSRVPSLNGLLGMPLDELARRDIAAMNLACVVGLPGAEDLDVTAHLATLDAWAAEVEYVTARNARHFRNNRGEYENSEAYWRMLTLTTVLQLRFGIRYNPSQIDEMTWADSRDLFLHGLTGPRRMGTCPSLPVLVVAVGRRLGYPLRLVHAPAHVFSRWDDSGGERLNIECHGKGMASHPDEHYYEWPVPWTAYQHAEQAQLGPNRLYLRSLEPNEELAAFVALRGHCLEDVGRRAEAEVAYRNAVRLAPINPAYRYFAARIMNVNVPRNLDGFMVVRSWIG